MIAVEVAAGDGPIVLGMPHTGTWIPDDISSNLNAAGKSLKDTDWHIDRLYAGLVPDASIVRATFNRYLIDANRSPEDESLYPGQNTTGLVPVIDFDGQPIWNTVPSSSQIAERIKTYHAVYHDALRNEIKRVRSIHGIAILFDCHSIRSEIPFLFDGRLPDFNIGTHSGASCAAEIERVVDQCCKEATGYSSVLNGRFKGGWTTRHYGRPDMGIHAIQMELAQANYLESEHHPFDYSPEKANRLRKHLQVILERLESLAPSLRN